MQNDNEAKKNSWRGKYIDAKKKYVSTNETKVNTFKFDDLQLQSKKMANERGQERRFFINFFVFIFQQSFWIFFIFLELREKRVKKKLTDRLIMRESRFRI